MKDIDPRVRNVLGLINHAIQSGIPFNGPEAPPDDTSKLRALLRKAASSSIVLLKNDSNVLPLGPESKKIAVIGPNAKHAVISGGGSASLRPTYTVTPLEGIKAAAKENGATVHFRAGVNVHKMLPTADALISEEGALMEFWNESPSRDFLNTDADLSEQLASASWSTTTDSTDCFLIDGVVRSSYSP